eukprot:TRINITY_DN29126_c0_g1_i1.p1 TRINITY_DN29126_c0_g1~~TRINITY_DN29126_c0_g1_i1.p1  ORF type:complete len:177 (+),score=30.45 TRINITY_DN29126_c0_g1_i1:86-616(+)
MKRPSPLGIVEEGEEKGEQFSAWMHVREGITEAEVMDLKASFDLLDGTGEGELDLDDAIESFETMDIERLEQEPLMIALRACRRRGTTATFGVFIDQMAPMIVSSDQSQDSLRRAWRLLDDRRKGSLTAEDLIRVARSFNTELSAEELTDMVSFADTDGNGEVSFDEFYTVLTRRG